MHKHFKYRFNQLHRFHKIRRLPTLHQFNRWFRTMYENRTLSLHKRTARKHCQPFFPPKQHRKVHTLRAAFSVQHKAIRRPILQHLFKLYRRAPAGGRRNCGNTQRQQWIFTQQYRVHRTHMNCDAHTDESTTQKWRSYHSTTWFDLFLLPTCIKRFVPFFFHYFYY